MAWQGGGKAAREGARGNGAKGEGKKVKGGAEGGGGAGGRGGGRGSMEQKLKKRSRELGKVKENNEMYHKIIVYARERGEVIKLQIKEKKGQNIQKRKVMNNEIIEKK